MNKPINIQSFVCEISKCPDIQRLKSENDALKSQLDFEIQKRETIEAENEELKRKNTILELITEPQREEIQKYRDKAIQFKQALEEVREIAIHETKELTDSAINGGRYLEILEIINEVLKDE